MKSISETIQLLKKLITDENCKHMNLSNVKGFLGELLLKKQLEAEGYFVEHKGNQTGYDLSVGHTGKVKIDVKTSTLKLELSKEFKNWGWALKHENKKKGISATHLVCIGLDERLDPSQFFVIPANLVSAFPESLGQFKRVNNALFVLPPFEKPSNISEDSKKRFADCAKILQNKSINILDQGQSFRSIFIK